MKRFLVFFAGFVMLYFVIQIGAGVLLTWLYVPNMDDAWQQAAHLPSEVKFGRSAGLVSWPSLLLAGLIALVITYWKKLKHLKK